MGCGASASGERYADEAVPEEAAFPESSDVGHTPSSSSSPPRSAAVEGRWLWEDSPDVWQAFDPQLNQKLLDTARFGETRLVFTLDSGICEVDLNAQLQTHWETGTQKRIRFKAAKGSTFTGLPPSSRAAADKHSQRSTHKDSTQPLSAEGKWQWGMSLGVWKPFDEEVDKMLSVARHRGETRLVYSVRGTCYEANLQTCMQTNLESGFRRPMRWVPSLQFQWEMKNGIWADYEEEENEILANASAAGQKLVRYSARGFEYDVNLERMEQENISMNSSVVRRVRICGEDMACDEKKSGVSQQGYDADRSRIYEEPRQRSKQSPLDTSFGKSYGSTQKAAEQGVAPGEASRTSEASTTPPVRKEEEETQYCRSTGSAGGASSQASPATGPPIRKDDDTYYRRSMGAAGGSSSQPPEEAQRRNSASTKASPGGAANQPSRHSLGPRKRDGPAQSSTPPLKRPEEAQPKGIPPKSASSGDQTDATASSSYRHESRGSPHAQPQDSGKSRTAAPDGGARSGQPAAGKPQSAWGENGMPPGFAAKAKAGAASSEGGREDGKQRKTSAPPNSGAPPSSSGGKKSAASASMSNLPKGVKLPDHPPQATEAAKVLVKSLGDLRNAAPEERRKAYRAACLRWHPDKNLEDEDTATEVFQFLQALKEWCLSDV